MGQGRRLKKKQGAPEPLSEEHFANLKRKAGLPADEQPASSSKKRRTSSKTEAPKTKGAQKSQSNGSKTKLNGNGKKPSKTPAKVSSLEIDSDEDEVDEFALSDEDSGQLTGKLGDDFLESEDESVFDSDQEAERDKEQFVFSEDEDDSDREEKLTAANIEGLSRKLDQQLEEDKAAAEAELQDSTIQTNIHGDGLYDFDDEDGQAPKSKLLVAPDLRVLRERIDESAKILEDSRLIEPGRSRADYHAQFLKDICSYYDYNEFLCELLSNLFSPTDFVAFLNSNETPRPVVIRANTLRTHRRELKQALSNRGVTLESVGKWSNVGLQIFDTNVPLGATPEYLAGHYMLQAGSSFLPVMALNPQPNERVLDMAAAPGGKSTFCAAMMKNTGIVVANDPNKSRAKGLIGNVHRLGVQNVVVSSYDAREFPRVMGGFDRVLLDAPCSGTGVIAKDPSVKMNKTEKDFKMLPHTQKQLILAAIDSAKTGGTIVYSTCSVVVEENEQVVAYALSRRPNVKLVDTELPFGEEGFTNYMGKKFPADLKLTRRYYPHTHNLDGFFVSKFLKTAPTPPNSVLAPGKKANGTASSADQDVVDKTPILGGDEDNKGGKDDFSVFDDEEDQKYIQRAKRNAMRRRGLDPNMLDGKGKGGQAAKTASSSE